VALLFVRPEQHRTSEQTAYLETLVQHDATIATAFMLAQEFGRILRHRAGRKRLEPWKDAVQASGIAELIAFVEGLAADAEAVANGCSLPWSNGMTEGFSNKVKWIKRSSYGQAGFPLLQRRVLLHPIAQPSHTTKPRRPSSACSTTTLHDRDRGTAPAGAAA